MEKIGCKAAYNLDGGQSALMWFNGRIVSTPYKNGRSVGYTMEYMRCECEGALCGETRDVRLTALARDGFIGEIHHAPFTIRNE